MVLAIIAGALFLLLAGLFALSRRQTSRLSDLDWHQLVARLEPLPVDAVAHVADEYLHPVKGQIGLDPNAAWIGIGGDDGLRRMRANAEVLIALAAYAQRWNFHESVIVAERMRYDGIALRRALFYLSLNSKFARGKVHGPFYLQQAVSSYQLMRQRLLALYETSHAGRMSDLLTAQF